MKITNWKNCIKNRSKWKEFVGKAKTSPKLYRLKKKKKNRTDKIIMRNPIASITYSQHLLTALTA
jgi:hypothetical protein